MGSKNIMLRYIYVSRKKLLKLLIEMFSTINDRKQCGGINYESPVIFKC